MLTKEERDEMRAIAASASDRNDSWELDVGAVVLTGGIYPVTVCEVRDGQPQWAEHIATFDPPTVLALLDALDEMERERDAFRNDCQRYLGLLAEARAERDEARAEVERLRDFGSRVDRCHLDAIVRAEAERDEARQTLRRCRYEAQNDHNHGELVQAILDLTEEVCDEREVSADFDPLINPGVRRLVALLNDIGWSTRDSGDGATHDYECDREHAYVVVKLDAHDSLRAEALLVADALVAHGVEFDPAAGKMVQATYSPHDGIAFVEVVGVTDADLAGETPPLASPRVMHDNCALCGQAVCGREGESYAVPGGVERVVQDYCLERMHVVADKQLAVNALEADGIEVVDSTGCFVDRWALRYAAAEHAEQPPQSVWRPHPDGGLVTEVDGKEWRVEGNPHSPIAPTRFRALFPGGSALAYGSTITEAMQWVWWRSASQGRVSPPDAPPEWCTLPEGWEP